MAAARKTAAKTTAAKKTATKAAAPARKAPSRKAAPPAVEAPAVETAPVEVEAPALAVETVPGDLALGDEGGDVKRLQDFLGVKVDGTFGPITEKALKRWQKSRGRQMTGVLDARGHRDIFGAAEGG